MKTVKEEMIRDYNIKELGFDFMGYTFSNLSELNFHHLIIAKKDSESMGIGDGYLKWNGAILNRDTAHDYLHLIQRIDEDIFLKITNEMIEENLKGFLDIENLKNIRRLLIYFEKQYEFEKDKKGKSLIKVPYRKNRITLPK